MPAVRLSVLPGSDQPLHTHFPPIDETLLPGDSTQKKTSAVATEFSSPLGSFLMPLVKLLAEALELPLGGRHLTLLGDGRE